jgi:hypothetical protein
LLGIGQTDRAIEPLMHAGKDLVNADASAVLLKLAEKIKTPNTEAQPPSTPPNPSARGAGVLSEVEGPLKTDEPAPAPVPTPAPAAPAHSHPASQAIIGGRSAGLTKTIFLTSLCALATGAGIRRFARR